MKKNNQAGNRSSWGDGFAENFTSLRLPLLLYSPVWPTTTSVSFIDNGLIGQHVFLGGEAARVGWVACGREPTPPPAKPNRRCSLPTPPSIPGHGLGDGKEHRSGRLGAGDEQPDDGARGIFQSWPLHTHGNNAFVTARNINETIGCKLTT